MNPHLDPSLHAPMLAAWEDHKTPLSVSAHRLGVSATSITNLAHDHGLPPRPEGRKKGEHYDYRTPANAGKEM